MGLHAPDLVQLVEEAVAAVGVVVAVQEAAALHVLQRVSFCLCFLLVQLQEVVAVLVSKGRETEVKNVGVH